VRFALGSPAVLVASKRPGLDRMEVRPMPTEPRTPAEHYREADRLAQVAESTGTDPGAAAELAGIIHALLASAARRARRGAHAHPRPGGGSPQQRWLYGDDSDGGDR
jgi:hypothetical protein